MKASVYTSLFNYSPEKFDLLGAFKNWSKYADEIVIATFEDQELSLGKIIFEEYFGGFYQCAPQNEGKPFIKLIGVKDTSLDDPLFDGKLKNAALQDCSNELVILQDMDERLGGNLDQWEYLGELLKKQEPPFACMIPVIDLYGDFGHYKNVNAKWYLSLKKDLYRGPVNFAKKENGLIDITKSDTTEAVDKDGNLVPYFYDNRFYCEQENRFDVNQCHVIHLGFLNLEKRVENNKFWKPHWESRCGESVEVATTLEKLVEENKAIPHGLAEKWWEN